MKTSKQGVQLIHSMENCKLTAYPDPGSSNGEPWTIGWGSTKLDGKPVKKGQKITQKQADDQFELDLAYFETEVLELLGNNVVTQSQFDALVSFAYNVGLGALERSTLIRMIRADNFTDAQVQFLRWIRNDGQILMGLVKRRLAEAELFGPRGRNDLIRHLPSATQVKLNSR